MIHKGNTTKGMILFAFGKKRARDSRVINYEEVEPSDKSGCAGYRDMGNDMGRP
jgi:hypothetical protein